NERADAGDQQHEAHRQRVEQRAEVHLQTAHRYPGEPVDVQSALLAVAAQHVGEQHHTDRERAEHGGAPEQMAPAVAAPPGQQQHRGTKQWQRQQQPHQLCHQCFSRLALSTEADRRARKIVMMIARPTTTSHAATTIVKNATIWPSSRPCIRANVTNARLTALSMSSTHMNITMALRRNSTPAAPMVNSSADR